MGVLAVIFFSWGELGQEMLIGVSGVSDCFSSAESWSEAALFLERWLAGLPTMG